MIRIQAPILERIDGGVVRVSEGRGAEIERLVRARAGTRRVLGGYLYEGRTFIYTDRLK